MDAITYYSDSLDKYICLEITFLDFDIETGRPEFEFDALDGNTDIRDQMPLSEQDECERLLMEFLK